MYLYIKKKKERNQKKYIYSFLSKEVNIFFLKSKNSYYTSLILKLKILFLSGSEKLILFRFLRRKRSAKEVSQRSITLKTC